MAVVTCKYHVKTPARWACEPCQINFCIDCIDSPAPGKLPRCPVCDRNLTSLGSGNLVTPYWHRLGQMFIYPLYPTPLVFMLVVLGLGYGFANIPIPIFNLLLLLILLVVVAKYAYVVLQDTAQGHLVPLPIGSETLTDDIILPFKQMALMFAFGSINFTIYDMFGPGIALIAYVVILLALPASTMVLAMEQSFFKALNPALVVLVINRIGLPYFFMVGLLYLLTLAAEILQDLLLHMVTPGVASLLLIFTTMYLFLVMFHLMGYVLYQYHDELGYSVEVEAEAHVPVGKQEIASPEMRATEILIAEGKNQEAALRLEQIIQTTPGNIEARERLLKLQRLLGENAQHLRQGQDYISYLFHENKIGMATKVYQECLTYDKEFRPARPNERVEIARMLRNNGQAKTAVALLGNLHAEFPTFDGIPAAYLMVAKMLCEQFSDDNKAKQILQFVLKYYPNHAIAAEAQEYLTVIDRLAGQR